MKPEQLLSPALQSLMSTFVGEAIAKADLPPLTGSEDRVFVQEILRCVVDAFWEAYTGQLGEAAQKQLLEAGEDPTGEKIWQWLTEHADFEHNEGARILCQQIMEDFRVKLPPIIAEAYKSFVLADGFPQGNSEDDSRQAL